MHHVTADAGVVRCLMTHLQTGDTIVDLAAGVGQYGHELIARDPSMQGRYLAFDGARNVEGYTRGFVRFADLSVPQPSLPVADWVLCLEAGEHIPVRAEHILLANIHASNRKGIILSWGVLGQFGHLHVNNHSPSYIIQRFTSLGYRWDAEMSQTIRDNSSYPWFRKSVYVFRR